MTEHQLDQIFKRAASASTPASLGGGVMDRVRIDDGRQRRWRVLIQMMIGAALVAGLATAVCIGWSLASKDETHNIPPPMGLFGEEARP